MKLDYVLITPARNEEAYIEKTIKSVVAQTIRPKKWVVVSDGSIDRTEEIVSRYTKEYDFIQLVCVEGDSTRNFGSKVNAFNAGYCSIRHIKHDFLGNIDADISFQSDYFETILQEFNRNDKLGIAGGIIYDFDDGTFHKQQSSLNSVAGAVQFFRKECFEEIGGYIPLKGGLIDAVAEVTARMHGWQTRSFPELKVKHYRKTGTRWLGRNVFRSAWNEGKLEYMFGYHPLFHLARICQKIPQKPFLLDSLLKTVGFWWCYLRRGKRPVSSEFINFLRSEELEKLKGLLHIFRR